ncbi:hypothetical protein BgAZ_104240 [Babesia gibsoni]|uniref:Ribosomal RNA-processing protein 42 n=1 Tax=Babesia gibsoni TaxID=33632 RepID=A0AAD8PFJ6_BABGI|nr:hypothetical protein BgAZ_104240 [Babesia gibsoni]
MTEMDATDSYNSSIPRDVYRQIDPIGFYSDFIRQYVRPNGRKLHEYRELDVVDLLGENRNFSSMPKEEGTTISSVRLAAGETHVHCVVKAFPILCDVPAEACPDSDSLITVDIELSKHLQPYVYDVNGVCANLNYCVSAIIENVLNSSDVLSVDQLRFHQLLDAGPQGGANDKISEYIVKMRLTWKIEIAIHFEEYDGNLVDMAILATSFALQKAHLPIALLEYSNLRGSYVIRYLDEKTLEQAFNDDCKICLEEDVCAQQLVERFKGVDFIGVPLHVKALPCTVTFLKFQRGTYILDPSNEEEKLGVNVSFYCLRGSDGSIRTQILNLMGCQGITADDYHCLEQVALDVIKSIANKKY